MKLLYHHAIQLQNLTYNQIYPEEKYSEVTFINSYRWFKSKCGFYPLFLAVGYSIENIRMTGYQSNWTGHGAEDGKENNLVLLSFEKIDGIYNDYDYWHFVLNQPCRPLRDDLLPSIRTTAQIDSWIFKKSWSEKKWISKTRTSPHTVQICVPSLDLRQAARIWVKDEKTQRIVSRMGFQNVITKKIAITGRA